MADPFILSADDVKRLKIALAHFTAFKAQLPDTNSPPPTTGTVTSIDVSGGTSGLVFTGGPVTTAGVITITSGALTVPFGGTGDTSLTIHGILIGNATNPVNVTTAMTNGQLLIGQTGADPLPKTVSGAITIDLNGVTTLSANFLKVGVAFIVDGGGTAISTGTKGYLEVPFNMTLTAGRLFADQTGSIQIDIYKSTYVGFPPLVGNSITGGNPLKITAAKKYEDTVLTGWTVAVSAGDVLAFNVDSASSVQRCTVSLTGNRT